MEAIESEPEHPFTCTCLACDDPANDDPPWPYPLGSETVGMKLLVLN